MSAFRFGLAGAGRMGRNHLRALGGSAEVEVAAIAEPSEATRRSLGPTVATVHEDPLPSWPRRGCHSRWVSGAGSCPC